MRLGLQVIVPLKNEFGALSDMGGDRVRPGRVALSLLGRPIGRWLALVDLGILEDYRYGVSLETLRRTRTGRWGVGGQVGCTGFLAYRNDGVWVYSDPTVWTGLLQVQVRVSSKDMVLRARMGQFLHRDRGVRIDLARTFRWLRLGFFGIRTTDGTTAGLDLRIPLSRSRWSSPRRLRVRPPAYFPWTYRYHRRNVGYVLDGRHRLEEVINGLYPVHAGCRSWALQAAYDEVVEE